MINVTGGYVDPAIPPSGVMAESAERGPQMRETGSSVLNWVKPMTYEVDTCRFLSWLLALIR